MEQYNNKNLGWVRNKQGKTRLGKSNEEHSLLSQLGTRTKIEVLYMH